MRDYDDYDDDHLRLYTPVLQRVIILAAVVVAVPVMMWTITTFVRTYVARPKVPALEHVASATTRAPTILAVPPSTAPTQPSGSQRVGPSDAPEPPAEPSVASPPDSAVASSANNPSVPSLQAAPAPAITVPAAAGSDMATGTAPPTLPQAAPRATDNTGLTSAPSAPDRGIAWPNPNTNNPPDFSASRLQSPPPPLPPLPPSARTAAAEILPANEPIRGPVPLPRHRPNIFAMAASGPVPLPRARPTDGPADNTGADTPATSRSDLESPR